MLRVLRACVGVLRVLCLNRARVAGSVSRSAVLRLCFTAFTSLATNSVHTRACTQCTYGKVHV